MLRAFSEIFEKCSFKQRKYPYLFLGGGFGWLVKLYICEQLKTAGKKAPCQLRGKNQTIHHRNTNHFIGYFQ